MKKYKLIKEYPGSPKLGTICNPNEFNVIAAQITLKNVLKYTEYWEEVVENFVILSVIYNNEIIKISEEVQFNSQQYKYKRLDNKKWIAIYHNNNRTLKENITIHSVERKKDKKIFTVGDMIDIDEPFEEDLLKQNIKYFSLRDNNIYIYTDKEFNLNEKGFSLCSIKHIKKPLFKTKDGVDVYEGEKVFWVINNEYKYPLMICEGHKDLLNDLEQKYKIFSTEKAAKEYTLYNNNCLSINDVINYQTFSDFFLISKLETIVKDRNEQI